MDPDLCADAVAVGSCSHRPDGDPMTRRFHLVNEETRRRVHVADHGGKFPIVPKISDSEAPRRTLGSDSRSRLAGNVHELAMPVVVIQNPRLLVIAAQMLLVH